MTSPNFTWQHVRWEWEDPDHTIDRHTNSGAFPWQYCDTFVIHYTAAPSIPDDTAGYLRAIQRDYITNRHGGPKWTGADGKVYDGYSIGYSAAVTQTGDDWELRGVRTMAAATSGWNSRSFACLVLVDGAEPCTPAAVEKVRELVAFVRAHSPGPVTIKGHQECGPTACPGAGVQAQIESGVFEPRRNGDDMECLPKPRRLYDSRDTNKPLGPRDTRSIQVGNFKAVLVNLTAVDTDGGPGYLTAWGGGDRPVVSNLNWINPRSIVANLALVPVVDGHINLFAVTGTHVIVDLQGFIAGP
jgi:hypothetical protein